MNELESMTKERMDAQLKQMETFVGFYTSEGFWVDQAIDPYNLQDAHRLTGIIPEIAVQTATDTFRALVCIDGLVLLRMEHLATSTPKMGDPSKLNESVEWWDEHLDYANTLLLLIESESLKCTISQEAIADALSISDTCRVGFLDGLAVNRRDPQRRSRLRARRDLAAWIAGGMKTSLSINETLDDLGLWRAIKKQVILDALNRFTFVSKDADLVRRLSFVAKAKSAYKNNDYKVSFTLLWFVIESSIKTLVGRRPQIGGRPIPVSEMVDELRKTGLIPTDIADLVHVLRKRRNQLVHEPGSTVFHPHDCMQAAHAATQLAIGTANIDLMMKWETGVQF
jgi:uncharacterized protein YutE (UPF0331/DUF86 family)